VSIIPYSRQSISVEDIHSVKNVLVSPFLTQGPKVPEFESALADYFETNYAVCCSSGTAALHLAYASLGVNAQSIAIVPAISFAATANAFRYLGCKVIFCDIVAKTGLMCTRHLEEILSTLPPLRKEQMGFIAPVSFAGRTAPLVECSQLANRYDFKVIEDASHAVGAWDINPDDQQKIRSGSCIHSDVSCVSFHPVKHICCGEGGVVLTNCKKTAKTAKKLRSHGIERPFNEGHETPWYYEQVDLGWNYRMTDLQAALGVSQLSRIKSSLQSRVNIAKRYKTLLSDQVFSDSISLPDFLEGHAWHLFVIRFKQKGSRNRAYNFLKSRNIYSQVHYIPIYKHPYYQKIVGDLCLPGTEDYFDGCLSIPMFPDLSTEDQDRVVLELRNFIELEN
jgi:dTDP-4-amino-4,6-dideoxygalactose transaminase